jgi:hypothetical protein
MQVVFVRGIFEPNMSPLALAIGEDPENTSLGRRQSPEASLRGHSLRDVRSILDQHRDPGLAASAIRKLESANKKG